MTIDEAILLLESLKEGYGGDMPLYVSKDSEGNCFRPLDSEFSEMIDDGDGMRLFDDDDDEGEEVEAIALWPC